MQVLLKLILTYNIYVGCVIYQVLSFPKPCTARAFAINVPNYERNTVVSINDPNNGHKSKKHPCWLDLFNSSTCSSNARRYSNVSSQSCRRSMQRFTMDDLKVDINRQNKTLTSLEFYWKGAKRNCRLCGQTSDMIYPRKLLGYELNFFGTPPTRHSSWFNRVRREVTLTRTLGLTRRKRGVVTKDVDSHDEDIDSAAWDNWSIWSACSVSCGQGRQVRWRHCLSADCIEGLKKAQLRSCRLKDCGSKGFLGWLGIKS